MIFLKVKSHANDIRISRPRKSWSLVANELITPKEAERESFSYEFIRNHMDKVEVGKNDTYWFFGCRFQKVLNKN